MPRPISAASQAQVRVVIVTMDPHLASACERAQSILRRDFDGLQLSMHAASEWGQDGEALERCKEDIARADIVVVTMLFMEDHFQPVLAALRSRRDQCDAMVCAMSAGEVVKLTRLGRFTMDGSSSGAMSFLKRLRGNRSKTQAAGAQQMKMLRRIPRLLRFIPGSAQDVRAYFLTLQYWLGGSEDNLVNMVRLLIDRYADGPRKILRGSVKVMAPIEYPEVGVYHPRLETRMTSELSRLASQNEGKQGTVGLLLLRSYLLAGNTAHYDGVITALEERGLRVIPAFAAGLDARPAIDGYFRKNGKTTIDALVSLTGFSLVGGPAYNDASAAEATLATLDVPYFAAHPLEFQTLEEWGASDRGLSPVENTIMVAIPELDGATSPMVFGGRSNAAGKPCTGCSRGCTFSVTNHVRDMRSCAERADTLSSRVLRVIQLRKTRAAKRRIAIVIFNFPPNAGNTGTAAQLSVFASLYNTLAGMKHQGYDVDLPSNVDELRRAIVEGNAAHVGAHANVHARIPADDHVRREPWLADIEAQWGPAPGRQQTDGASIFVLGAQFGSVFVGVQPSVGYEGDPMKLLFQKGFAPTHAFSAFYRYLRDDFKADAVLHFGTHGALEFMPGKQAGLSASCWPDRLIADLPNFYLYASNNPSEGTIAKRRSGATLISYLTPPITNAGLYRGLSSLKASIDRWRSSDLPPQEQSSLARLIQEQAADIDLATSAPSWHLDECEKRIISLNQKLLEVEYALIPHGLHVVGQSATAEQRIELLEAIAKADGTEMSREAIAALIDGAAPEIALATSRERHAPDVSARMLLKLQELARTNALLAKDHEVPAILQALDGRFIRPAAGGDLMRTPSILPTGRNLHGFDPFRIPSTYAMLDGAQQAERLLKRHMEDGNPLPESIALVLWGTDNLKSEGGPIGQALALFGARPRFDSYGRLAGATLITLEELQRPRVDVVVTLSGIFRDLMPLQIKLLAEAAFLAASADEPLDRNFVRKHALSYQQQHACDLETAALRVFGNADGTYGSNVNHLIENGRWANEDELAETYSQRKSFAYGRLGRPLPRAALLQSVLADVELTYQNLDSVELGVTTIDTYFDTLGGISQAVKRARGKSASVYIGDQTSGAGGQVRTLAEQVALETRTRMLNPKWYEGMLEHGYEGVRQIETHVTNTMGWSATTGQVAPWIYQQLTETFMLDEAMRERLSALNPTASAKVADRLLEAHKRKYWNPDSATLDALRRAGDELEDRLEGIFPPAHASEKLAA